MILKRLSLRRRIIASFLATTTIACLLLGLFSFLFAYSVEDTLFEDALKEEVARQQVYWAEHGRLDDPGRSFVEVHRDPGTFPADLRRQYRMEAGQEEFSGDAGRHYHLRKFNLPGAAGTAYAVAEVSRHLVVRPIREEMLAFLALSMAGLLLATGVLGYWLAERATAPLTRLATLVSRVDANRIPRVSADAFPPNEIGLLADALERAFDRIRSFVEREVRFTRDASHELRTPLAVIRSAVELVEARPHVPPEISGPIRRISDASLEMERTITLLLLLAREENSTPEPAHVPLLPLIETAVLRASERFGCTTHSVTIDVKEDQSIWANPTALGIVLDNLIGNAFQHSRGGRVSIKTNADELVIVDTGPGIPESVGKTLYQPFSKGDESRGHGLGLSIVRRLCDRNDIALTFDGSAGAGATVRLEFKRASFGGTLKPD